MFVQEKNKYSLKVLKVSLFYFVLTFIIVKLCDSNWNFELTDASLRQNKIKPKIKNVP